MYITGCSTVSVLPNTGWKRIFCFNIPCYGHFLLVAGEESESKPAFEDKFCDGVTVGELTVGETAELLPAPTSLGLAFFGVTLLPSEVAGRLDTKPLSFRPTVV